MSEKFTICKETSDAFIDLKARKYSVTQKRDASNKVAEIRIRI